ncbi:histidine kinase [Methylobacterium sp. 4-46]|uniref:ATP-binding protein n=1 Tax=unclassified Methylobacterium TaxID=2615210 RepID=UPI000165C633|nr:MULTISPECIES: ATP-binding protein [Methylobacterium]ACA16152.1 histidine kinase [Methylobacterium sp. 4-46]WFT81861.1 ATP-binding protein [Methylobacterium nodulans]
MPSLPFDPHRAGAARRAAWRAALIAALTVAGAAAWERGPDLWLGLGTAAAVLLGGWLASPRAEEPLPRREGACEDRPSLAEALLANIPDPVILIDRRALVIEANAAARALLPTLRPKYPLSFALRDPGVLDGIETVLHTGAPLKTLYAPRVPTERTFEVQIGAMKGSADAGGQPNLVLFLRDLTSAKRLETMRVDFVANASHELRTPLASLLGFIETLQGPARNDSLARDRFLAIMREQALRMTRLIDDLLSLSRIELRAHVPPTTVIEVGPLARQIVDSLSPLAEERGVAIALEEGPAPLAVLGERDEILRLVENLVENAVKYGGEGGRVSVRVSALAAEAGRPAQVEIAVADDGPGIAPEHLPRLTERFYRVDPASSRQQGGTGLGLAIVKHILNRHRGRLVVESEPGRGSTFRASIPAAAGAGREETSPG